MLCQSVNEIFIILFGFSFFVCKRSSKLHILIRGGLKRYKKFLKLSILKIALKN